MWNKVKSFFILEGDALALFIIASCATLLVCMLVHFLFEVDKVSNSLDNSLHYSVCTSLNNETIIVKYRREIGADTLVEMSIENEQ